MSATSCVEIGSVVSAVGDDRNNSIKRKEQKEKRNRKLKVQNSQNHVIIDANFGPNKLKGYRVIRDVQNLASPAEMAGYPYNSAALRRRLLLNLIISGLLKSCNDT